MVRPLLLKLLRMVVLLLLHLLPMPSGHAGGAADPAHRKRVVVMRVMWRVRGMHAMEGERMAYFLRFERSLHLLHLLLL